MTFIVQLTPSNLMKGKPRLYHLPNDPVVRKSVEAYVVRDDYGGLRAFCEKHSLRVESVDFWLREW